MELYTKKGDQGETGLLGGRRLGKDHHRVAAYGGFDELNAVVGLAAVACMDEQLSGQLRQIQGQLCCLCAELATDDPGRLPRRIEDDDVTVLEAWIDAASEQAGPLQSFILPGGSEASARLHLARAVCRRAERGLVLMARGADVPSRLLRYVNRLSDLLFALARVANKQAGVEDIPWDPERKD